MNKPLVIGSIVLALGLIGFAMYGAGGGGEGAPQPQEPANVVEMVDGTQVINVTAKGGYSPRIIQAKANTPTVLKMSTKGTFDCSAAFTIPELKVNKFLPASGVSEFPIPPQVPGEEIKGLCSMGMYSFTIKFQ